MIIKRINQHPELIPILATWFHHEWGGLSPYHSIEKADFFKKLGWQAIDSTHYGQTVTIMEKRLNIPMVICQKHKKYSEFAQKQEAKFAVH